MEASLPQGVFLVVLNHLRRSAEHLSVCQRLLSVHVLTRTRSRCTITPLLVTSQAIRMFPGALSRLIWLCLFCFAKNASWYQQLQGSSAKLDSLEIISWAVFCIIGLTNIPKIEFLPPRLDLLFYLNNYGTCAYQHPMKISNPQNKHPFWLLHVVLKIGTSA